MIKSDLIFVFLFCLIFILSIFFVSAIIEIPNPKDKYVNDFGSVLDENQQFELRILFSEIDFETTAELTFISVQECNPYSPSDLAIKISQQWMVGKADKDNGLLILYCIEEKKIFVVSGYGLEGILPDSKIGRLLDESYIPLRDAGDVSNGILEFSYLISQVVIDNKSEVLSGKAGGNSGLTIKKIIFYFFIFLIVIKFFSIITKKSGVNRNDFWFLSSSNGGSLQRLGGGFGGGKFGGGGTGR